ncbi:MAG TPA: hypothetical protein VHF22_00190 [Planctomycetota bacterium]|nr:hypothetical protein [Planctomycetota bacterium]
MRAWVAALATLAALGGCAGPRTAERPVAIYVEPPRKAPRTALGEVETVVDLTGVAVRAPLDRAKEMAAARARALGGDCAILTGEHDEVVRAELREGSCVRLRERHYRWVIAREEAPIEESAPPPPPKPAPPGVEP